MTILLKVCGTFQNIVFGIVLHSMGLLWSADDSVSNLDCAALRAMTGPE
jgi:triphosphoribosyl-dephospho-CoA synthetase